VGQQEVTPAEAIVGVLAAGRFDLSAERHTQAGIAAVLELVFPGQVVREARLSAYDRPDFLVEGVAIEVKVRGARRRSIHHQLERYAAHDQVAAVVLFTGVAIGLPPQILGKPAYVVSAGRAWL
jgi:hypothetical protein